MKIGVRGKLIALFTAVIVISLSILGVTAYFFASQTIREEVDAYTTEIIGLIRDEITNYFDTHLDSVKLMANNPNAKDIYLKFNAQNDLISAFQAYINEYDDVDYVYLGTERSEFFIWPETDIPEDYDPTVRPWYIQAQETGDAIWTDPYVDAFTGDLIISAAMPVSSSKGDNVGVLSIDLSLAGLSDKINSIEIGDTGYPVVLDSQNNYMIHPNKELIGEALVIPEILDQIESGEPGIVTYEFEGKQKIAAILGMDEFGWTILSTMEMSEIREGSLQIMNVLLIGGVIVLAVAIVLILIFSQLLLKPVFVMGQEMERVKAGDFTAHASVRSKDELGALALNFNEMVGKVRELISSAKDVAQNVSHSSTDLAATSEQTSALSNEVAKTVDEIAKGASDQAMDAERSAQFAIKLDERFSILTESSQSLRQSADDVATSNQDGLENVEGLKVKTKENNEATSRIETAISSLAQKSEDIDTFVSTISSIAEQTNLLALNASIEAARAGEHGRGFAVVADEIRKLAEGSNEAAEEIRKIVGEIQQETRNTTQIMQDVQGRSAEQTEAVNEVSSSFERISDLIDGMLGKIQQMGGLIEETNADKEAIVGSIENISAVSEETAASTEEVSASVEQQVHAVEEVAKAAENLNEMAQMLNEEISRFKV